MDAQTEIALILLRKIALLQVTLHQHESQVSGSEQHWYRSCYLKVIVAPVLLVDLLHIHLDKVPKKCD